MYSKKLILAVYLVIIGVLLLLLPAILGSGNALPFCSGISVNAQDNPCLAQEATNSAQQIQILELQLTNTSLQSTITAYESNSGFIPIVTNVPGMAGFPFTETFDNNDRGWPLTQNGQGAARISQGQLRISANPGHYFAVVVPELSSEQAYLEADMTNTYSANSAPCRNDQFVGFVLGDPASDDHYLFVAGFDEVAGGGWNCLTNRGFTRSDYVFWFVRLYQVNGGEPSMLFETPTDILWQSDVPVSLGLEARNGSFNMYINGNQMELAQVTPNSDQIGLVVFASDTERTLYDDSYTTGYEVGSAALFDNLNVRAVR